MNVSWRQEKLRAFCNEKGIRLSAWSLLAANGTAWGSLAVMESPILKGIALARGKTLPQVALTWLHQHGVTPIVKSFNKERMKQNFQFLGWQLTKEGLEKIKQIPLVTGFSGERFVHKEGPCKTIEEFWA